VGKALEEKGGGSMPRTRTGWFGGLCRFVLFCFTVANFHPASLGVPWKLDVSFDPATLTLNFELGTLNFGPTPAYGQDANLASTPEADTSDPFIVSKAAELNRNPQQIFGFVRGLGNEVYDGSLRGARGTLWSKAGNALDKASLLIALLRASNIPARYVQGTLGTAEAQQVILSMFPPVLRIVGCPPADAQKADPANDPTLLGEAKKHYWVEFNAGGGFTPADPTLGETIGQTFAPAQGTFAEVPDNLRHKVTVRLKAEVATAFSGNIPETSTVLDETFITAAVAGKPLTVGHFVNSTSGGNLTHTYAPYLLIGQSDDNIADDPIIRGTDYQEFFSSFFPIANLTLTGVFLEMDVQSPSGTVEKFDRPLVDRIGFVARQTGAGGTINVGGG
jgi:hypothetical protein